MGSPFQLFTEDQVRALFAVSDSARCLIQSFEIVAADGSAVQTSDALYSLLLLANRGSNVGIQLDSTVAQTDGTVVEIPNSFLIKATATGGATISMPITAKIIVCRFETLSSGTTISETVYINPQAATDLDVNAMFSSNDSFCPPNQFVLSMDSPSDPATATSPSATDLLSFTMDSSNGAFTLHLLDSDVSTHTFYVLARSVSGNHVYQQVDLTIECADFSQTLTLSNAGADLIERDKNQGTISLLSESELLGLFVRSDTARCPIQSFELLTTADVLIETGQLHTLFDVANRATPLSAVKINTDIASAADIADTVVTIDNSFKIKATALGGAVASKQIDSSIVVCRNEVISLVDQATLTHS